MSPEPIAEANRKRKREEADSQRTLAKKETSKHDERRTERDGTKHSSKSESRRHGIANDNSGAHRKRQRVDATDQDRTSPENTPANGSNGVTEVSAGTKKKHKKHGRQSAAAYEEAEQRKALELIDDLEAPAKQKPVLRREGDEKGKDQNDGPDEQAIGASRAQRRAEKRKKKKEQQKVRKELEVKSSWGLSEPIGGQFIDVRPVFSQDEKYIIIATSSTVQVYSTSDSLLERSLRPAKNHAIVDYKLSPTKSNILYVLTVASVIKWDFEEDKVSEYSLKTSDLTCFACFGTAEDSSDILLTVEDSNPITLKLHSFPPPTSSEQKELNSVVLLKNQKPIREISAIADGRFIIGMTMDGFIIGQSLATDKSSLEYLKYTWREIPSPEKPMCFDVRLSTSVKGEQGLLNAIPSTDLAIGGLNGCIYLFEDLLNKLVKAEQPNKKDVNLPAIDAKEFHWHREAVGSVTWSKDGNYLISGGQETVLVLWQLETGRKQFLPHLESPIRNIVISPTGTSYGIRLGDNSVMVLSTSELKPTANINGIQSLGSLEHAVPKPLPPTLEVLSQLRANRKVGRVAATINPKMPDQLLLAAPAHQNSYTFIASAEPAPYLQTYNLSTSRHLSRQALLRTNATNTNLGPDGNKIREPNLKFVKISHDGAWLATIDEWSPPQQDLDGLTINGHDVDGLEASQRESYFKFWRWNKESQSWMLNSRIDRPHQLEGTKTSGRILDLVAFPSANKFATIGEDSVVKIWKSKSRKIVENIKLVKDRKEKGSNPTSTEVFWTVEHSISLEKAKDEEALAALSPKRACLALSNDGSVLAISQYFRGKHSYPNGLIRFIDADNGALEKSQIVVENAEDGLDGLGFIERYLVCLSSRNASIWDVTSLAQIADVPLQPSVPSSSKEVVLYEKKNQDAGSKEATTRHKPSPHLAVDLSTSTFAISYPEHKFVSKKNIYNPLTRYGSRLQVYSLLPEESGVELLYESTSPRLTLALLSAAGLQSEDRVRRNSDLYLNKKGFIVLDAGAEVSFLRPRGGLGHGIAAQDDSVNGVSTLAEDAAINGMSGAGESDSEEPIPIALVEQPGEEAATEDSSVLQEISASLEKRVDDRPMVRPEQLAQVFDHPSHAMPSVLSMFNSVVRLFASGKKQDDGGISPVSPSTQLRMEI